MDFERTTLASKIAAEAVAQRRTDPQASAPDVLHLVMTGDHHQDVDFDGLEPPAPFALIVPTVLVPALAALARRRGIAGPVPIDTVKLSHHGSRANVTQDLLRAANARHFVFSTAATEFDRCIKIDAWTSTLNDARLA